MAAGGGFRLAAWGCHLKGQAVQSPIGARALDYGVPGSISQSGIREVIQEYDKLRPVPTKVAPRAWF